MSTIARYVSIIGLMMPVALNAEPCFEEGLFQTSPSIVYSCNFGSVELSISRFLFSTTPFEQQAISQTGPLLVLTGSNDGCGTGVFSYSRTNTDGCSQTYQFEGTYVNGQAWQGVFSIDFSGACFDCTDQMISVNGQSIETLLSDGFES